MMPVRPLVYVDEAYFYSGSDNNFTWATEPVPHLGEVGAKMSAVMAVVIVPGTVHRPATAEFVGGGSFLWQGDETPSTKRSKYDDETIGNITWLRSRNNPDRYLFDKYKASQFESYWRDLVVALEDKYGACDVVLDNLAVHVQEIDRCPTSGSRKEEIREWLVRHRFKVPSGITKKEMEPIRRRAKAVVPRQSRIVNLARERGHEVYYLPSHHPWFNAIETVWAEVKNALRQKPARFRSDFYGGLRSAFASITPKSILGAHSNVYCKLQEHVNIYTYEYEHRLRILGPRAAVALEDDDVDHADSGSSDSEDNSSESMEDE
jgi:transposase